MTMELAPQAARRVALPSRAPLPIFSAPPRSAAHAPAGGSTGGRPAADLLCASGVASLLAATAAARRAPARGRSAVLLRRSTRTDNIWQMLDVPTGADKDQLRKGYKRFVKTEHPDVKGPLADRDKFNEVMEEYKRMMELGDDIFNLQAGAAIQEEQEAVYGRPPEEAFWSGRKESRTLKGDDTGTVYRVPKREAASSEETKNLIFAVLAGFLALILYLFAAASTPQEVSSTTEVCDESGCEEERGEPKSSYNLAQEANDVEERLKARYG